MTEIADNFLIKDDSSIIANTEYSDNSVEVYKKLDHHYGGMQTSGSVYGKHELYDEVEETPTLMPAETSRKGEEERAVARAYEEAASKSVAITGLRDEVNTLFKNDERLRAESQSYHNNYIQGTWKKRLTEEELKQKIPVLIQVTDPYEKNLSGQTHLTTEVLAKNDKATMYSQTYIPERDSSKPIVASKGVNNYEQFALLNLSREMPDVSSVAAQDLVDTYTDHSIKTMYGHLAEKNERKPFDDVSQMKQSMFIVDKMGQAMGGHTFTSTHLVPREVRQLVEY